MVDTVAVTAAAMVVDTLVPSTKAKWIRALTCVPLEHHLDMVNV